MNNICENCIDCNCMKCSVFAHEVYEELGYYETDEECEDENNE